MSKYIPIDCNFYDELVLLAMHKTRITFVPNIFNAPEGDFIVDLVTEPTKEEFLVLKSGIKIRLDRIAGAEDNMVFLTMDTALFEEE